MLPGKLFFRSLLGLAMLLGPLTVASRAREPQSSQGVIRQERVIAGGPKDSIEVRHLVLRGTNEAIGRTLAQLARERYQVQPQASQDPLRTRAQRRFIEKEFPILHERMRGAAAAFGHRLEDDAWNHSTLDFTQLRAGCSVMHLPPRCTAAGTSVVSRDYDYSTGSISFGWLPPGMLHSTARPYLLELHPDRGYASVAMVAYDLLSGVLDGMNSEGLTVSLMMDDELFSKHPLEPTGGPAVGLGVLQTLRLLLDTCATVPEAKETLLQTKQYYEAVPVHYLIADRFGNAFVWEYSHAHNKEFIVENPDQPLVATNFTLHRHLDNGVPPSVALAKKVCSRYCRLTEQLAAHPDKMSEEFLRATHKKADAELPKSAEPHRPPIRTFWHALYFPEQRQVKISFYLHDEEIPGQPNKVKIVRSDYLEFALTPTNIGKAAPPQARAPQTLVAASKELDASAQPDEAQLKIADALRNGGAGVKIEDNQVVVVNLDKAKDLAPLLPLLQQLPELTGLSIKNPNFDDSGLALLKGLPKLKLLYLFNSKVGDEGLKVLDTMPNLRELAIGQTKVTDAGLEHLKDLIQLEYLGLAGNNITDAGLVHIKGLTNITGLSLAQTKITDAGLENLKGMSRLTKLNLSNTAVTDEGLAKAKKSLPFWLKVQR